MKTSGRLFFEVALRNCPFRKDGLFAQRLSKQAIHPYYRLDSKHQ